MAGRPSKIDQIVGTRDVDGQQVPVTAADRITSALRTGNYFEQACAAAGVHRETAYGWLRVGAQLHARAAAYDVPFDDIDATEHERRCAAFSDAVAQAEAEWEVAAITQLEALARGGTKIETVTVKDDGQGNVLERSTRTETLPPNAQVIEWRLTRRHGARWGDRVEVLGRSIDDALPLNDRAEALASELRAYLEGVAEFEKPKRKRKAKADAPPVVDAPPAAG